MITAIANREDRRACEMGKKVEKTCTSLSQAFLQLKDVIDEALARGYITAQVVEGEVQYTFNPPTDETLQKDSSINLTSAELGTFLQEAVAFAVTIPETFKANVDCIKR